MSNQISQFVGNELPDGTIVTYLVKDLWDISTNLETFDLDLDIAIYLFNTFLNDFNAGDWERVIKADLSYPILVNDTYGMLDGCHRAAKALLLGHTTIRAKRIVTLPKPLKVYASWEDYHKDGF